MSDDDATPAQQKPPPVDRMSLLWRRINEHKIVQWSVAYVALAYAIQHAVTLTSEAFDWPHAVERISMLLLVLGLPLVMTLAWYHGARASRRISGAELSILATLLVGVSILFYVFFKPAEPSLAPSATQQANLAPAGTPAAQSANSLAVLPFANLSSDKEQEFFSDGMTDEITSALAKVRDLRVVGRSSAFQFKGQNKDLRAIGQSLNARYLIDGSVRKAGDRVRITAQLIEAGNGVQLWSENYDRELKDVFAVQEDIAQAIAASLRVPLGLKQGESLVPSRTANLDSYQDYLRARALVRGRGPREPAGPLTEAAKLLEQVVARDPNYAPAWAVLGQAYALIPTYSPAYYSGAVEELRRIGEEFFPKAEMAAQRAISLDPNNADGYATLAFVRDHRNKFIESEDLFKQALSVDPGNPESLQFYSLMLAITGRLKEALALRDRLQALEPFVPAFNAYTAQVRWVNGQNDAAIATLKALPANELNGAYFLPAVYAAAGHFGEAADLLLLMPPGGYDPKIVETAARLLRAAPAQAAAPQSLPRLGVLSFVYLYVGEPTRALETIEGGFAAGVWNTGLMISLWHTNAAPLRKTERFKALMRKANLVDYWKARGWPDLCHPTTGDDFACE
jgi:TolB-like protein